MFLACFRMLVRVAYVISLPNILGSLKYVRSVAEFYPIVLNQRTMPSLPTLSGVTDIPTNARSSLI
jgi:hypothetical protein